MLVCVCWCADDPENREPIPGFIDHSFLRTFLTNRSLDNECSVRNEIVYLHGRLTKIKTSLEWEQS